MLRPGSFIEVELSHTTEDNKGLGWYQGKAVLIEDVDTNDGVIRAEVVRILEETIIAKRTSRIRKDSTPQKVPGAVSNPYQIDEDFAMDQDTKDEDYPEEEEDDP